MTNKIHKIRVVRSDAGVVFYSLKEREYKEALNYSEKLGYKSIKHFLADTVINHKFSAGDCVHISSVNNPEIILW